MKINNINKGAEENNKINGLLECDTRYSVLIKIVVIIHIMRHLDTKETTRYSMLIKIVDITLIVRQMGIQYIDYQHIINKLLTI